MPYEVLMETDDVAVITIDLAECLGSKFYL